MADETTTEAAQVAQAEPARQPVQQRELELQAQNEQLKTELSKQRKIAEDFEKAASRAGDNERRLKALEGDLTKQAKQLKKESARADQAEREAGQLRDLLQKSQSSTIKDLPKTAVQLKESVTTSGLGGVRVEANAGDVLAAGSQKQADELQKSVGTAYRVFAVTKETVAELARLGLLQE